MRCRSRRGRRSFLRSDSRRSRNAAPNCNSYGCRFHRRQTRQVARAPLRAISQPMCAFCVGHDVVVLKCILYSNLGYTGPNAEERRAITKINLRSAETEQGLENRRTPDERSLELVDDPRPEYVRLRDG